MNARLLVVSTLVVAGSLALVESLHGQADSVSAAQFRAGARSEKDEILSRLATHRASATTPAELRQILVHALEDSEPSTRRRALSVVASRAGAPRLSGRPEAMARAKNELPDLIPLRTMVLARFSDSVAEVRAEAALAIGNLDAAEGGWGRSITLKPETVEAVVKAFNVETDHYARVRLIELLAVSTNPLPRAEAWWPELLRDSSSSIRYYVVRGAKKLPAPVALPLLVKALSDQEDRVRLASAPMFLEFKSEAFDLIPTLLDAADKETDPMMKKTFHGIVEQLRGK